MYLAVEELELIDKVTGGYAWLIKVAVILGVTLCLSYIERLLFHHLLPKYIKSGKIWDIAFLKAFYLPIKVMLWLVGITLAIREVAKSLNQDMVIKVVEPIRGIGIIVIIVWSLNRFIQEVEAKYIRSKSKENVDKTMIKGVALLMKIIVFILAILVLMQTVLHVPLSGILAFGGLGGAVVGFAAKDLFANFFGGLAIFLDRPFVIGDWIRSPDREIEGHVEDIGWRLTKILTLDKRPLYIPNAIFSMIAIENPSRMLNRRIKATFGIRYTDAEKLPVILKEIEDALKKHPDVDATQTLLANFVNFGPSSLEIQLYLFTKATKLPEFQKAQESIFLKVLEILASHKAQLAFPTTTLHLPDSINPLSFEALARMKGSETTESFEK